jgi:hypothetical protein
VELLFKKINKGIMNYYPEINLSELILGVKDMISSNERVKRWRNQTKSRIVKAMGEKCVCCGYKDCDAALSLHHLDPSKKEFSFSKIRANPKSWQKIVAELRKCILVCCRCHQEIHAGFRVLPDNLIKFDEDFVIYKQPQIMDDCPICGNKKMPYNKTCSYQCAGKITQKVDWNKIDLTEMLKTKKISLIADELGVSWNAVKKRVKKLGLI